MGGLRSPTTGAGSQASVGRSLGPDRSRTPGQASQKEDRPRRPQNPAWEMQEREAAFSLRSPGSTDQQGVVLVQATASGGEEEAPRTPSSPQGRSEGRQGSGQRWVCGGHTPCSVRAPGRTLQPQPPTQPHPPYLLKRPTPSTTSRIRLLSWAPAVRYLAPSSRGAPRAAADSTFLHSGWGLRGLQGHG